MPYNKFRFVYISPPDTYPMFGNITLRNWSKMCEYFSNTNTTSINKSQTDDDDND